MGNFLLQRGHLLYVLSPESCDSYMIILLLLHLLFVCICLVISTDHMFVTFATDGQRVGRHKLALAFEVI